MLFISYITALLLLLLLQMYRTVINRHRPQRQANMWLVIFPLRLSNVIFLKCYYGNSNVKFFKENMKV